MSWFAKKADEGYDAPEYWRARMVEDQLRARGVHDERVVTAFARLPRHEFCPEAELSVAYGDHPVSIGHGQTVSQPFMVAWTLQTARLQPNDRVLEVGTGSGYQAALLAMIVAKVYTIECVPDLLVQARQRFMWLELANIESLAGDGSLGWPERAPFDAIIYAAAAPEIPRVVRQQLTVGGRIVAPVGKRFQQELILIERAGEHEYREQALGGCSFVPLRGAHGWSD